MNKLIKIAKNIVSSNLKEEQLVQKAKKFFDNGSSVKPLSEFGNGGFGLWLSGEGTTTINGLPIADYYNNYQGLPKFQKFCEKNNLDFEWYDAGTILCYMN